MLHFIKGDQKPNDQNWFLMVVLTFVMKKGRPGCNHTNHTTLKNEYVRMQSYANIAKKPDERWVSHK